MCCHLDFHWTTSSSRPFRLQIIERSCGLFSVLVLGICSCRSRKLSKNKTKNRPRPAKISRTQFRSQERTAFRNGVSKFDNLEPLGDKYRRHDGGAPPVLWGAGGNAPRTRSKPNCWFIVQIKTPSSTVSYYYLNVSLK